LSNVDAAVGSAHAAATAKRTSGGTATRAVARADNDEYGDVFHDDDNDEAGKFAKQAEKRKSRPAHYVDSEDDSVAHVAKKANKSTKARAQADDDVDDDDANYKQQQQQQQEAQKKRSASQPARQGRPTKARAADDEPDDEPDDDPDVKQQRQHQGQQQGQRSASMSQPARRGPGKPKLVAENASDVDTRSARNTTSRAAVGTRPATRVVGGTAAARAVAAAGDDDDDDDGGDDDDDEYAGKLVKHASKRKSHVIDSDDDSDAHGAKQVSNLTKSRALLADDDIDEDADVNDKLLLLLPARRGPGRAKRPVGRNADTGVNAAARALIEADAKRSLAEKAKRAAEQIAEQRAAEEPAGMRASEQSAGKRAAALMRAAEEHVSKRRGAEPAGKRAIEKSKRAAEESADERAAEEPTGKRAAVNKRATGKRAAAVESTDRRGRPKGAETSGAGQRRSKSMPPAKAMTAAEAAAAAMLRAVDLNDEPAEKLKKLRTPHKPVQVAQSSSAPPRRQRISSNLHMQRLTLIPMSDDEVIDRYRVHGLQQNSRAAGIMSQFNGERVLLSANQAGAIRALAQRREDCDGLEERLHSLTSLPTPFRIARFARARSARF
jgi:hypothetical protein